jgi:hypothetical protein
MARRTLLCAAIYLLAFAAVFPDADLAHRLALGPALLVITVALSLHGLGEAPRILRLALVPVMVVSGAQLARSALLYAMR